MRLLLLLIAGLAQLLAADPARDARWRQDLDTIATRLPALHPNLFFQTPRAVFDQSVSDLRAAIPDLSDTEVMTGLARIVALPGDGHTNLFLTQRNSTFRLLPISMRWFEDGLFVIGAGNGYLRALGARVVRIGDRSADEALQAITPIVSRENEIWVREVSPNYLVNANILQALKIAPDNRSVRFEFEELGGARFTLEVASLDPGGSTPFMSAPDSGSGFIPLWRQRTNENYWFTYVQSSRTLYFAYNVCGDQAGLPFTQFNTQLWAVFDSQPVEHFILDLRNNSGGNSQIFAPFVASGLSRAQRFAQAQPIVIIGRRTYSSAIINAIQVRQGNVRIYGEPSGGSPNSYGEVLQLVLPNSQLIVNYSTKYFSFPGYPPGSLMPDLTVKMYSADYFARHDPFVAAALAGSSSTPSQPVSDVVLVSAAHFRADRPVAPGSLAAIFGDFPGATSADGLEVLISNTNATLLAVSPGQINLRVPEAALPGIASIRVRRGGVDLAVGSATIQDVAPGLFVIDATDVARPGAIVAQGGSAAKGSVIEIYGTGQGVADPGADTRVFIGMERAEVLFSGAQPAFPGLWQVNARVPDSASLSGQAPVFVVTGSNASNAVTVKVANQ